MIVSLFRDFKYSENQELKQVFDDIKHGAYQKAVLECRELLGSNPELAEELKNHLPAFTSSGVFTRLRQSELLQEYSGVVCLDADDIGNEKVTLVRDRIAQDEHTLAVFVSPSGTGLKVLAKVDTKAEMHEFVYLLVGIYYNRRYEIPLDWKCRDITRLCFVSYDPGMLFNLDATSFAIDETWLAFADSSFIHSTTQTFQQIPVFKKGDRNSFVYHLANNLNRKGIPREQAQAFITSLFDYGQPDEITQSIKSAYSHTAENGIRAKANNNGIRNKTTRAIECLLTKYEFRSNVVSNKIEYRKMGETDYPYLDDRAFKSIWRDLQENGHGVSEQALRSIIASDFSPLHDPIRDYYQSLPCWNPEVDPDYIAMLAATVVTADSVRWRNWLQKFIIGMVACSLAESVNQHALILVGKQGIGKTTWLLFLIPKKLQGYVYSGWIDPTNKDTLILLAESVLINLDELENLTQRHENSLKDLITKPFIKLRPPYGRTMKDSPRRASFVGSVNTMEILHDLTGSRRFLCFEALSIDLEAMRGIDLDGVYAQAYSLYQSGFQFWFDLGEIQEILTNNEPFQVREFLEELIIDHFEQAFPGEGKFKTATDMIIQINYKMGTTLHPIYANQVGKIMTHLKFIPAKRNGRRGYWVNEKP